MNKLSMLLFLALSSSAMADPAVQHVQVNIHNNSRHMIELRSFDSERIFESTAFINHSIAAYSSVNNAVLFSAFDKRESVAGVNVLINGEAMKLMWQANMGFDGPDAPKFHICGVIKDGDSVPKQEYCDIPYVVGETLVIDFNIK